MKKLDDEVKKLQAEADKKIASFDKLQKAKDARAQAEENARKEKENREREAEAGRREKDLAFEKRELTAVRNGGEWATLDEETKNEIERRLTDIEDELQIFKDVKDAAAAAKAEVEAEKAAIREAQEAAERDAREAEEQWLNDEIAAATEAYEEGKREYEDAQNEVEVYREILSTMTKEDDPDLYNEYKDIIRGVQM